MQILLPTRPQTSRKLAPFHWATGLVLIAVGLFYLVTQGYWYPVQILIAVYPPSLIIIGSFLLALDWKFGDRAIPIAIMSIFTYDLFVRITEQELTLILNLSQSFFFQVMMSIGGYYLAKKPEFRFSKWVFVFLVPFLLLAGTRYYHLIEIGFYVFIFFSLAYPIAESDRKRNLGISS